MHSLSLVESDDPSFQASASPFSSTRSIARNYGCDIAVPNVTGIGDVLMYTRLAEDLAMHLGRPLKVLTGKLRPVDNVGRLDNEEPYPIWKGNPFVSEIVDGDDIAPDILEQINAKHERHCQFGHMIANICAEYGLVPRKLHPAVYLTEPESREALLKLSHLQRPILCIHPYGTSSPLESQPWYRREWVRLLEDLAGHVSIIEIGLHEKEDKHLSTNRFRTTLREMMALVWASDIFLGFDSSVAHVATAFSKPAMVLWDPVRKNEIDERLQPGFGPAAFSRWSYPQNRNMMLLGESNGEIRKIAARWILDFSRSTCPQY
jgi:hypothetical protein